MNGAAVEQDTRQVASQRTTQDLYRLLIVRNSGSELLVAHERPPFTLPSVEIPRWERVAENLTEAVRKRYGISAICLFSLEPSDATANGEPPLYQVMETREAATVPSNEMRWLPLDSISDHSFADEQDLAAITDTFSQIAGFQSGKAIGRFGRPGWIQELFSWVERETEPYGLRLTGNFRQLNASPTFSLIRIETNAQAVWFKAVGEPNLREFPIAVAVSNLFPGFVPSVIATHPAWNGWLTMDFAGSSLDEIQDSAAWVRASETLARLQIESRGNTEELLEAKCTDLRVPSLLALVDPFVEVMSDLMERQLKTPPPILGRDDLRTLGTEIKASLSKLVELNIPDTLGHLDFNPGNIICSSDQCAFLDWAEAYVGPPFFTVEYLHGHLLRLQRENAALGRDVIQAYTTIWRRPLSARAVFGGLDLAALLAVFAYAVGTETWRNPTAALRQPATNAYFRGLTRRMNVEMQRLQEKRQLCCK